MTVLKRYSHLYIQFLKNHLKMMIEYKLDFLIGMTSLFISQGTAILFIGFVFNHIQQLNGWSFYEILFIFGIASCGRAIHQVFFDNLWMIGANYIRPGNFDRLMVRPVNPLFHLVADKVNQDGFGQLLIGMIILTTAAMHIDLSFGVLEILLLLLMVVSSGLIFVAINLIFATLSFWMVDSMPIIFAVHSVSDFARYPITIYHTSIRFLLTWIVPYGFTAFYPSAYFIDHSGFQNTAIFTPLVAIVISVIAYLFWNRGLRSFESTGS
ncbi:ABC transporter permease [Marinicrinis sediminis]|uniref:ABC transporter permease n=1 Tax=Marinicrinis sediminis TaxID=1652465 RepID=A0ABW5R8M3_9BACL